MSVLTGERIKVIQVEMHVTHSCNLACEACTHFSNEIYSGRETPDSFRTSLQPWTERLMPSHFLLLGGEPTLNPDLCEILEVARELWPEVASMMLVTNGWFLKRHPRLPEVLKRTKIHLDVSIHYDSPEYTAKLAEIEDTCGEWGIPIRWRPSFKDWTRYYQGAGVDAAPFEDADPRSSWNHCDSRHCLTIHEGRLWKCPPLAYLPMHVEKYGDKDGKWAPYLAYRALEPTATLEQVKDFVNRKVEHFCSMCPAKPQPFRKADPLLRINLPTGKEKVQP